VKLISDSIGGGRLIRRLERSRSRIVRGGGIVGGRRRSVLILLGDRIVLTVSRGVCT